MRAIVVLFAVSVVILALKVVEVAGRIDHRPAPPAAVAAEQQLVDAVSRLNAEFQKQWQAENVHPAAFADDLTVLRRRQDYEPDALQNSRCILNP